MLFCVGWGSTASVRELFGSTSIVFNLRDEPCPLHVFVSPRSTKITLQQGADEKSTSNLLDCLCDSSCLEFCWFGDASVIVDEVAKLQGYRYPGYEKERTFLATLN